jgi:futalosine hydrolase
MILAVTATELEMSAMLETPAAACCLRLVTGVGQVESCLRLSRYLSSPPASISLVVHFGVAGAYPSAKGMRPALLDICLATTEINGDLGICYPSRIDDLGDGFRPPTRFILDSGMATAARGVLEQHGIPHFSGNFVTVNCASGTRKRGEILCHKYNGLCENMEGAAVARVCADFGLPLIEVRCISNFVEDRDLSKWCLTQACEKGGRIAALIIAELEKHYGTD